MAVKKLEKASSFLNADCYIWNYTSIAFRNKIFAWRSSTRRIFTFYFVDFLLNSRVWCGSSAEWSSVASCYVGGV